MSKSSWMGADGREKAYCRTCQLIKSPVTDQNSTAAATATATATRRRWDDAGRKEGRKQWRVLNKCSADDMQSANRIHHERFPRRLSSPASNRPSMPRFVIAFHSPLHWWPGAPSISQTTELKVVEMITRNASLKRGIRTTLLGQQRCAAPSSLLSQMRLLTTSAIFNRAQIFPSLQSCSPSAVEFLHQQVECEIQINPEHSCQNVTAQVSLYPRSGQPN